MKAQIDATWRLITDGAVTITGTITSVSAVEKNSPLTSAAER